MTGWRTKAATPAQLAALAENGINVPFDCSRGEASRLIGLAYGGPAHQSYVDAAALLGIDTSVVRSRDDYLEQIWDVIRSPGRERDMCRWYAYRAYRRHVKHRFDVPIDGIGHPQIAAAAEQLHRDQRLLKSVRRSLETGGILQFTTRPNEQARAGPDTLAYKAAVEHFSSARPYQRTPQSAQPTPPTREKPIPFPTDRHGMYSGRRAAKNVRPAKLEVPEAWRVAQPSKAPKTPGAPRETLASLEGKLADLIGRMPASWALGLAIATVLLVLAFSL